MGEKQQWSSEQIKCLLETCIEEVNTVGRKGLSLQKESWIKLGKVLKEKCGLDFHCIFLNFVQNCLMVTRPLGMASGSRPKQHQWLVHLHVIVSTHL